MSTLAAPVEAAAPSAAGRRFGFAGPPGLAWLALALILAVGGFARLNRLDLVEFKADEAQVSTLALAAAHGQWPAASLATSNGGLDNPPLPLYLFALPALFSSSPAWQAAVSACLDLAAIALVFLIGRRFFSPRAGLAAAAFYAAAAYPAIFSRKLAGPYLEPFFSALLLACLLAVQDRDRARVREAWLWCGAVAALGALVQVHLGALLLAPAVALLLALSTSPRALAGAALGAALVALAFAPYLLFEAGHRSDFLQMVARYVQGRPAWTVEAFRHAWVLVTSPAYGDLTGSLAGTFNAEVWPFGYVTPLAGLALLAGLAAAARRWREPRMRTLLVVVLAPLALTVHHGPGLELHYFAFLLPGLFLLAGIGLDAALLTAPAVQAPAYALLAVLLAVQAAASQHFTAFLQAHRLPDSYGLPMAYQERVFQDAAQAANGGRVMVAVTSRDEDIPARYFLGSTSNTAVDAEGGVLLPAGGGLYVALDADTAAARARAAAFSPAEEEPLPGGGRAAVYRLPADAEAALAGALAIAPGPQGQWDNGLRLLGVAAPRALPGQLAAAWQVTAPVDASTIIFNQLVDDSGKQWFDRDAVPVEAGAWKPGDQLILLTPAAVPADAPLQEYWWSLGLYVEGGRRVFTASGGLDQRVARLKGGAAPPVSRPLTAIDATFADGIALRGYSTGGGAVTLEWLCAAPVGRDYTVFVHELDAAGVLVAQQDSPPAGGRYPTSLWDPGERIEDRYALSVPAGARLEVGLYDPATGQRLRLASGADHLELTPT
jgi:4-amino-4-deoxy-L-arabinose transferase-like glycosyltransferase